MILLVFAFQLEQQGYYYELEENWVNMVAAGCLLVYLFLAELPRELWEKRDF